MALLLQLTGTGSVSGTVVSAATGEPISGVSVVLVRKDPALNRVGLLLANETRSAPGEKVFTADLLRTFRSAIEAASLDGDVDPPATAFAEGLKAFPLDDILELRVSPIDGAAAVFRSSPPTLTDAAGRFSFEGIPPGNYRLTFSADGLATQAWGQHTIGDGGVPFTLSSGEHKSGLVMRMSAPGAVSGRLFNQQGQVAPGVPVNLLRSTYDANGEMQMRRVASSLSDDRGEYRLFYLPPGHYFLSAGHAAGELTSTGFFVPNRLTGYISPNQSSEPFGLTYYPGVSTVDAAAAIDVQPGAEVTGIDLRVNSPQSFRVRGRIIDSSTKQPPEFVTTTLSVESDVVDYLGMTTSRVSYNRADGAFEIPDLPPGAYRITARGAASPPTLNGIPFTAAPASATSAEMKAYIAAVNDAERARPRASAGITVTNADVDGVLLTLVESRTIAGSFRVDGQGRAFSLAELHVELRASGRSNSFATGDGPQFQAATADGNFRIRNVLPGGYRLRVFGIPEGYYIKEARLGDNDVLESPLIFSGLDPALNIVLSPKVANVEGIAVRADGQPMPVAQVVLIPGNRERVDLFKTVVTDSRGRFAIPSAAPGNYTLAAWETLEPYAYFDPEQVAQAEQFGTTLRLAESSSSVVSIAIVPAGRR
jgi:5-hydroxyisourate hydrolase-like protein (transthyretin family)